MKKLLSIIGAIGLGASAPAPLLANAPTVKQSEEKTTDTISIDGIEYQKEKIDGVNSPVDSIFLNKDTIYFISVLHDGIWFLKHGEEAKQIKGIIGEIYSFAIDNSNNIYFGTKDGAFVLKQGETTATKIDGINGKINSITIDNHNNIYLVNEISTENKYKFFKSTNGSSFVNFAELDMTYGKINSIVVNNKNKIIFGSKEGVFFFKQGSETDRIDFGNKDILSLAVDNKDNIYYVSQNAVLIFKQNTDSLTEIKGFNDALSIAVDSNKNNLYIGTTDGIYKLSIKPYKMHPAVIAGIAIGSVAGVAFVVLGSCYLYQYLNKKKKQNKNTDTK